MLSNIKLCHSFEISNVFHADKYMLPVDYTVKYGANILTAFRAPLALKEPVFWKFSHFMNTFLPTILLRVCEVMTGVW